MPSFSFALMCAICYNQGGMKDHPKTEGVKSMEQEMKVRLISAIDEYNEAQPDESKHINVYDTMNKLNGSSDEEISKEIGAINTKTDELES